MYVSKYSHIHECTNATIEVYYVHVLYSGLFEGIELYGEVLHGVRKMVTAVKKLRLSNSNPFSSLTPSDAPNLPLEIQINTQLSLRNTVITINSTL